MEDDTINIHEIISGNSIPITIVMILACTILVSDSTLVLPLFLFMGIIFGIIKRSSMKITLISSLLAFIIGSVISIAISLISIYYTYGALYAIMLVQSSLAYIIVYTIIGCIGSSVGYYVYDEIKTTSLIK